QGSVLLENRLQVPRSSLLLALEEQLEVHRRPHAGRLQGVDGAEHGDDRRLVVARRPAVESPLALDCAGFGGQRNGVAARLEWLVGGGRAPPPRPPPGPAPPPAPRRAREEREAAR